MKTRGRYGHLSASIRILIFSQRRRRIFQSQVASAELRSTRARVGSSALCLGAFLGGAITEMLEDMMDKSKAM